MKNIIYVLAVSLLGSSVVYADSHARATITGEVNFEGVDFSVEAQARESLDVSSINLNPFSLPKYSHTQLNISKVFADIYTLKGTSITIGGAARNAVTGAGNPIHNRLQVDMAAKYSSYGLGLALGKSIQHNVENGNLGDVSLGSFVMRDKLTLDYSHSLYDLTFGVHAGDEVFFSEGGIIENRVLAGASVKAFDDVTLVTEYFVQTQGELLTPDLQVLGDHENAHVVALNVIVSF